MNDKFTVEEVNLICIFECKSRTKVISDIKKAIKHLDDGEMVEFISEVSDSEQTKRAVLKKTGTALNVILHHCTKSRLFCQ